MARVREVERLLKNQIAWQKSKKPKSMSEWVCFLHAEAQAHKHTYKHRHRHRHRHAHTLSRLNARHTQPPLVSSHRHTPHTTHHTPHMHCTAKNQRPACLFIIAFCACLCVRACVCVCLCVCVCVCVFVLSKHRVLTLRQIGVF